MVPRKLGFAVFAVVFVILMTSTITPASASVPNSTNSTFQPSSIDIEQLLPDPEMDVPPDVHIRGTTGEFSSSHQVSTGSDSSSHAALTWTHTAGTPLNWYSGDNDDLPDCEDFIYLTQEFDWNLNELPVDAYLNMSFSLAKTGDFGSHEEADLMFKLYVWLIDSSGNWRRISRSFPPYSDTYQTRTTDLNYIDVQNSWGGMIEDSSGIQEDPTDILTLAVGLAPTDNFYFYPPLASNPWNEYNGTVSVNIQSVSLYTFSIVTTEPDDILYPLVHDIWGGKTHDIFPDAPASFENTSELCRGIATGDDSSVYILTDSFSDYGLAVTTGQRFQYQTILKYDSELNPIWVRTQRNMTYGFDICFKDGFIYSVGYESGEDGDDLLLTKWTPDGAILWDTTWDSGIDEHGGAVGVTNDGSIFVLAERNKLSNVDHPYWDNATLLKFNSNGVLEWDVSLGYISYAFDMEIEAAPNGIYTQDGYLSYRDFLGDVQWALPVNHTYPNNYPVEFTTDSEGNLFSSQRFNTERGVGIQVSKTDGAGNTQWNTNFTISYPGGWDERLRCQSMSVAPDGSLIAYIENDWLVQEHYFVKFSSEGEYQWHKQVGDDSWWYYPARGYSYLSIASNGIAYFAVSLHTTLDDTNIGIFSYDVGVSNFSIPIELLLLGGASLGIVAVTIIIVKKRPQKDYYGLYKERYDL